MSEIKKITNEEASKLLDSTPYEPIGLFYTIEKNTEGKTIYVGINNSTGDAWTEDFKCLSTCKRWLLRGGK